MPWILNHNLKDFDSKTIWHAKEADGSEPNDIMRTLMGLPGKWPDPKYLPLHLHEIHENGKIYGFMQKSSGSTLVSSSFRDFIEEWDPGHSFYIPVILYRRDGEIIKDQYFWHKFKDFIPDAFVMEESDVKPIMRKGVIRSYDIPGNPKLTWKSSSIAGRHFWAAEYLEEKICVSDEFMDAIEARGDALFEKIQTFVKYIN